MEIFNKGGVNLSNCVQEALEKYGKIVKYDINPFRCLYFNPKKYDIVGFAKWCQKYLQNRVYMALVKTTPITGFEVVPSELLQRHAKRAGLDGRNLKAGGLSFYLLKQDEMSKGLLTRYLYFKEKLAQEIRIEYSSASKEGVAGE